MNLKERLKYYHIRCINCDCMLKLFEKEIKTKEDFICPDCGKITSVFIGQELYTEKMFNSKNNLIYINCNFINK